MHSFDDYYYFYLVVKHGGFSAASEASNITKSKLSHQDFRLRSPVQCHPHPALLPVHFKVTPLRTRTI